MQRRETTAPVGSLAFFSPPSKLFLYPGISFEKRTATSFPKELMAVCGTRSSDGRLMSVPYLILFGPLVPSTPFARDETEAIIHSEIPEWG